MEWFAFEISGEYFRIDSQYIFRVVQDAKVAPVPLVPQCYMGLIYYRGELFDVVDIGSLMGNRKKATGTKKMPIILVKWSDKKLALATDKIIGLVWKKKSEDENNAPTIDDKNFNFISPEIIMKKLLKLNYGPNKIQKDLFSGIRKIP